MQRNLNAFVKGEVSIPCTGSGLLQGLNFAVKDVFSVKNWTNGAGNPDWLQTHQSSEKNANVIEQLLASGASLTGITHTDELMFGLNGENFHYGTPVNPHSPERIPGGSSSGSAVSVAAGLVDFALGTDTAGSVRVPAAYCGVYGFRPTHGVVPIEDVIPLAKSYDTVGWMAREVETLYRVGECLIEQEQSENSFQNFYYGEELWALADKEPKEELLRVLERAVGNLVSISVRDLSESFHVFRTIQGIEIWMEHGEWIKEVQPNFGPGVAKRFAWASTLDPEQLESMVLLKNEIKQTLANLLKTDGLLVLPTTPGIAPLLNTTGKAIEEFRMRTMQLTCLASLCGFPQVTIPIAEVNGSPIGVSFIANEHQDINLLKYANHFVKQGMNYQQ